MAWRRLLSLGLLKQVCPWHTKRSRRGVRLESAFGGKADMGVTATDAALGTQRRHLHHAPTAKADLLSPFAMSVRANYGVAP